MKRPRERRPAFRVSQFLSNHQSVRNIEQRLTRPLRGVPLPVLAGNGRGLKVRFGPSALMRAVASVELDAEEAFLSLLAPGDVVYDVGANIGWYSLLAARRVGPGGGVIAFEPALTNAAHLQANAKGNGFENVTAIAAAVADHDGWASFLDRGSLQGRLTNSYSQGQEERRKAFDERAKGTFFVPVLALDSWIAATGQRPPDIVKIDVEGAEVGVLRGMSQTLQTAAPTLLIELHATGAEVAQTLDSLGYDHSLVESSLPTKEAPYWAHVLARPRGDRVRAGAAGASRDQAAGGDQAA